MFDLRILRCSSVAELRQHIQNEDESPEETVRDIIQSVKATGVTAVIENGLRFGDLSSPLQNEIVLSREELKESFDQLSIDDRDCLIRVKHRIERFATAQKNALLPVCIPVPGGTAGHDIVPVFSAGCYAPGGRYPLPSSVLMTVVTARAAGVERVIVASPKPSIITRASAFLAGADGLLVVGGAAAIAALAYGMPPYFNKCDVVVGPGNRFVTEAKRQVSGDVRIDLLAGPSELFILADDSATPRTVACDMIAQAEHDIEASAVLITDSLTLAEAVRAELSDLLSQLPETNKNVASASLSRNSGILLVSDLEVEGVKAVNDGAPEHLEIVVRDSSVIRPLIRNAGAIFEGESSAEVFGDYGIGPNHTLPTARAARFRGGLSVYDFLRVRTWVRSDQCDIDYKELVADTLHLAKLEGLYGHAMSADCRSDTKMIIKRSPLVGIIRADVDGLMEYHPVKHPIGIAQEVECTVDKISKLNANENAYGPPNGVGEAVAERMAMETSVYPDPDQIELRDRLVEYTGRRREEIVCGAGGDDIIQLLVQICRRSGVVISTPTFPMYDFFARINGTNVFPVPLLEFPTFHLDIHKIVSTVRSTGSSLVCIASPNNPTGGSISLETISTLCSSLKSQALIAIDEAYVEFSDQMSAVSLLDDHPNLCVIRTFSKWAGLAGLRCGYCLGHPDLIKRLIQIKIPYNLNIAASVAACYALDNRVEVLKSVELLKLECRHLQYMFQSEEIFPSISCAQSDANFVLIKIKNDSSEGSDNTIKGANNVYHTLRSRGILTRKYETPELENCIRISSGTPADTRKMISILSSISGNTIFSSTCLPSALLWDMDGVLADVSESYRAVIVDLCSNFGIDVKKEEVDAMKSEGGFNNDWVLTQELIRRKKGKKVPITEISKQFNALYQQRCHLERLIVPIEELRYLANELNIPMGIVTGRPRCDADVFLNAFGVRPFFQCVVCLEDTKMHKPNPEPILLALEELHINSSSTESILYFGDTVDDMSTAIAATEANPNVKIKPIGILPPQHQRSSSLHLYDSGAVIVGARWDCIAALGFPMPSLNISVPTTVPTTVSTESVDDPIGNSKFQRTGSMSRVTKETSIFCNFNLDGSGQVVVNTGVGFLNHMIDQLGKHGNFDIELNCQGDLHIDDHHTVEDCAIVLGQAIDQALGNRCGIRRFGYAYAPLDESLSRVIVDISGRRWAEVFIELSRDTIGGLSSEMVSHFFHSLADSMKACIHVDCLRGTNSHHQVESAFKALALALNMATSKGDSDSVPSTKGTL